MEIDKENSTFECIKFKTKGLPTYEEIHRYFKKMRPGSRYFEYVSSVPCSCIHELKLVTYRKLLEVADYLNEGWKPNWSGCVEEKFTIFLDRTDGCVIKTEMFHRMSPLGVTFKTEELAKKAIEIIGEEELIKFFS